MTIDDRAQVFLAMLRHSPTDVDCTLCLSQLEAYVQSQFMPSAAQAQFGWLRQHLDSCAACAQAYGLLYELVWAEENGRLPQPTHVPEPDLRFLRSPFSRPSPAWLKPLQAALRITPEQIGLQLNETLTRLLLPAPGLAPTRSVGNGRGHGRYQPKLLELTPDQAQTAAIPFTLTVYADGQQPDRCLVEVMIQPPGQSWPDLGGRQVTVTAGGQPVSAETDDWGTAVFPDLPRSELDKLAIIVHNVA
jgi:hypothetical protein